MSLNTKETQKSFTKKTTSVFLVLPELGRHSFTSFKKMTFLKELEDVRKVRSQGLQRRRQSGLLWKPESHD